MAQRAASLTGGYALRRFVQHDDKLERSLLSIPSWSPDASVEEDVSAILSATDTRAVSSSLHFDDPLVSESSNYAVSSRTRRDGDASLNGSEAESIYSSVPGLTASLYSWPSGVAGPNSISSSVLGQRQVWRLTINESLDESDLNALDTNQQDDEMLEATYPCPFNFLKCAMSFTRAEDWIMHSLYHFRGHPPPKHVSCPLSYCQMLDHTFDSGEEAWRARMGHMAVHHQRGEDLEHSHRQMNQHLFQYLRSIGVICDADLQVLRREGELSEEPALLKHRESRRDRRRNRR